MIIQGNSNLYNQIVTYGFTAAFFLAFAWFCMLVGYPLFFALLLVLSGIYLHFFNKANFRLFLNLGLLFVLILFLADILQRYPDASLYYLPLAGFSMLVTLLFNDLQFSFLLTLLGSVFLGFIFKDQSAMVIFFVGGLTGSLAVKEARTRGHLIGAGLMVSFLNIFALVLLNPSLDKFMCVDFLHKNIYPLIANGFISAFFVGATLKVFESAFGVLTNYSLLELADFNQPLLKKMIMEAPGTYHHSLIVGNLAEAAADEIGANALLCRVGAYYHDIGKMAKPDYYTENQLVGGNKHDTIEPSISRLVILNHIKEGVELARKNKLNPRIIDFITEHHGKSLVYYFYQKALEASDPSTGIKEEDFRYPGPKPKTSETAIAMLADSSEGAVRSLPEANSARIEETVKKIVNNKFIDGQLDECPLTLCQIDKISSIFIRILTAMYHGRAKYPEKKNGNNHRKSAKKTSDKPQENQGDSQENPSSTED